MSNNSQDNKLTGKQQLHDIKEVKSTLGSLYGFITATRSGIDDNFKKLHIEHQKHLHILLKRADLHFYIIVILLFILFCQSKLGSLPLFASLLLDQILLLIG